MSQMTEDKQVPSGAPRRARRASRGGPDGREDRGRFSSRRKTEAVLRLLRGESLDSLSRELGVGAATIAQWRERFLAGGQGNLRSRPEDDRDAKIRELHAKLGELVMDNEVLRRFLGKEITPYPLPGRKPSR